MNVIHRGVFPSSFIDTTTDQVSEKFGPKFVNINKKKVLKNWIKDEIVKFERGQEESLKNIELQSGINDSMTNAVDSSYNYGRNNRVMLGSQKAISKMSSHSQFNKTFINHDDQQKGMPDRQNNANTTSTALTAFSKRNKRQASGALTQGMD